MKTKTSFFGILLSLFCCINPLIAAVIAGNNPDRAGSISVFSTPDLYPLTVKWAGEYCKLHPDQQISVIRAEGAELSDLAGKSGQVGFISGNDVSALDREPAWEIVVGRDVIVPVINAANPFLEEIGRKGVAMESFEASIGNPVKRTWGALLKNDQTAPVNYYIVNDRAVKSGLAAFLKSDQEKIGAMKVVTSEELAVAVGQDPFAVGFCRLTDILAANGQDLSGNIRLFPIDKNGNGKLDYMEQIYDDVQAFSRGVWIGKYPKALTCDIFSVSSVQPANETGMAFLSWVLTDGQQFLNQNGFCDLVINERQSQLDKVSFAGTTGTTSTGTASYQKYLLWGLAALLALGFLSGWAVRLLRKQQAASREVAGAVSVFDEGSVEVPQGLYFDKTHTWAFMEKDGTVKAGIDDFLVHVTGPVTRVEMKNPGEKITKGEPFLTIIQKGKKLIIHSPVSGTIRAQNRDLTVRPTILHSSPYSDGWVYQIQPANWLREIQFLSMAEKYRNWLTGEFSRLKDFLALSLRENSAQYAHVILQDGGTLKDNFLAELGPEVWEDFQNRFLDSGK
jgi:glycine cleavage system H lipoate-binding protein/ABC-type phosphate transport system substrate-binding protein